MFSRLLRQGLLTTTIGCIKILALQWIIRRVTKTIHTHGNNFKEAFIPGERLNGIHTVDFLIWKILVQTSDKNFTHLRQ